MSLHSPLQNLFVRAHSILSCGMPAVFLYISPTVRHLGGFPSFSTLLLTTALRASAGICPDSTDRAMQPAVSQLVGAEIVTVFNIAPEAFFIEVCGFLGIL